MNRRSGVTISFDRAKFALNGAKHQARAAAEYMTYG